MEHRQSRSPASQASLLRKRPLTASYQASPLSSLSRGWDDGKPAHAPERINSMLFLTRWFGVTGSEADRNLAGEQSDIEQIVQKSLLMQANAAAKQHRP